MSININDLDCNSTYSNPWQTNDVRHTENMRELTEQEQQISGGGTGNFSLTVTDGDGKTIIDEKTTFPTGSVSVKSNIDVIDEDDITVLTRPVAFVYPSTIGFAYFFDDDDDEDTSSTSNP